MRPLLTRASVLFAVLAVVCGSACTTRETGSIDLLASSAAPAPSADVPCGSDGDCPGDPRHRLCRASDGTCVECRVDADCIGRPEPHCDARGHCVPCPARDATCPDGATTPAEPLPG